MTNSVKLEPIKHFTHISISSRRHQILYFVSSKTVGTIPKYGEKKYILNETKILYWCYEVLTILDGFEQSKAKQSKVSSERASPLRLRRAHSGVPRTKKNYQILNF
jgi:hypothetical protein